jgi:hypothetical protein
MVSSSEFGYRFLADEAGIAGVDGGADLLADLLAESLVEQVRQAPPREIRAAGSTGPLTPIEYETIMTPAVARAA